MTPCQDCTQCRGARCCCEAWPLSCQMLAALLLQVSPKSCGHVRSKQVVSRAEAVQRVRAAVDARQEGQDIVIVARSDARQAASLQVGCRPALRQGHAACMSVLGGHLPVESSLSLPPKAHNHSSRKAASPNRPQNRS